MFVQTPNKATRRSKPVLSLKSGEPVKTREKWVQERCTRNSTRITCCKDIDCRDPLRNFPCDRSDALRPKGLAMGIPQKKTEPSELLRLQSVSTEYATAGEW